MNFFLIIIISIFHSFHVAISDKKSVSRSHYVGKQVTLAPFAIVTKMINYGRWTDKYLYLFANSPNKEKHNSLNEFTTYKVIDEKNKVGSFIGGSDSQICILENTKKSDQKVTVDCKDIELINEATIIYKKLSEEVKANRSAFVATDAYREKSNLKKILKINRFIVFEVNSDEDIKEILAPNGDQDTSYDSIIDHTHPIFVKKDEIYNEATQSKIFIHYHGGKWNSDLLDYNSFESHIANNAIPAEMEKWVNDNFSNSQDRWAVRALISVLQQMLRVSDKLDTYRSMEAIAGLEASKACLSKYFSKPESSLDQFNLAVKVYLEDPVRAEKFRKVKSNVDFKMYNPKPINVCYDFFPPTKCNETDSLCEIGKR